MCVGPTSQAKTQTSKDVLLSTKAKIGGTLFDALLREDAANGGGVISDRFIDGAEEGAGDGNKLDDGGDDDDAPKLSTSTTSSNNSDSERATSSSQPAASSTQAQAHAPALPAASSTRAPAPSAAATTTAAASTPAATSSSSNSGGGGASKAPVVAAVVAGSQPFTKIASFAWSQGDKFVSVHIDWDGARNLADDRIVFECTEKAAELRM